MDPRSALRFAKDFITAQGGSVAALPLSEEELNPELQDDLSIHVTALESTDQCYDVPYSDEDSAISDFAFFEDGRQRTLHIGYVPVTHGNTRVLVPVHYFAVGAVILARHGKKFRVWLEPEMESGILVESSLLPDQGALAGFVERGLTVFDTGAQGGDYYDLRRNALNVAKQRRLLAEDRLISKWRSSDESARSFLVVDGTLMNFRNEDNVERCVGVSKSFGSRYFGISENNRILEMEQFKRSWAFRFHSPDDQADDPRLGARDRISWYLRLRRAHGTEPEFGLIRVEISQRHASFGELIERFSRSLISERLPTSYPAPRWDNHLFPITACERYLSSVMPSTDTICAVVKA